MHPFTRTLSQPLAVFLENETIRPEVFIDFVSQKPNSLPLLVSLFNHVRFEIDKELRHQELEEALEEELTKRHFIQVLPGRAVVLSKKCYVSALTDDALMHIASFLKFRSLESFTATCQRFRQIGLFTFTKSPRNIQKLISQELARQIWVPRPFALKQYAIGYDLTLSKVRSVLALKQFPGVRHLKLLDAKASLSHVKQIIRTTTNLRSLYCGNIEKLAGGKFAALRLPATLESCTLLAEVVSDQAVRALATQCPDLRELVLHKCSALSLEAFTVKSPFVKLEKLALYSASYSDVGLKHVLSCCPRIRSLDLTGCEHVTGSTLLEFKGLEFLEELILERTNLTNELFKLILAKAKNLARLNISFCDGISRQAFAEVVYPPNLQHFSGHWVEIGNEGLYHLLDSTTLATLDLTSCVHITNQVFEERPYLRTQKGFDLGFANDEDAFAADF